MRGSTNANSFHYCYYKLYRASINAIINFKPAVYNNNNNKALQWQIIKLYINIGAVTF